MRTGLRAEAVEFAAVVDRALTRLGGPNLVRRAEVADGDAGAEVAGALGELGVWELRPRQETLDAEVAAAVCRIAGRYAVPYPVAERLAGDPDAGIDALAVVGPSGARIGFARPELRWAVSDGERSHASVSHVGPALRTKLGAGVSDVEPGEWSPNDELAPLALTLPMWTLLGMCDTAVEHTRRHLLDRHQFGQPLASFQALRFQLADTVTALAGYSELAHYTSWAVATGTPGRLADALGLRVAALETAETVFRTCHQMHGAMGFCDEVDLSWLSRYSQPLRRLPWGRSESERRLLRAIELVGFDGLFSSGEPDVMLLS